jgi:hypothetical protein
MIYVTPTVYRVCPHPKKWRKCIIWCCHMVIRVNCFVHFLDDTNLFLEGNNPAGLFERASELGRWFRCNRFTLDLKKTEYIPQEDKVCPFHRSQATRGPCGGSDDQSGAA